MNGMDEQVDGTDVAQLPVLADPDLGRVRWRCRRGMLELDMLLGKFLDEQYLRLNARQRQDFAALLELGDPELWQRLRSGAASSCEVEQMLRDGET